jgi:hypothetical protein
MPLTNGGIYGRHGRLRKIRVSPAMVNCEEGKSYTFFELKKPLYSQLGNL